MGGVKRWTAWGIVPGLLVLLAGAACAEEAGEEPPSFDPVLADMGQERYLRSCASCHGVEGRGDGPAASVLQPPPADLTRIAERRGGQFPSGEIARFIDGRFVPPSHGSREMPVWGERFGEQVPDAGVSEEVVRGQIAVLVEYLKSIQVEPGS